MMGLVVAVGLSFLTGALLVAILWPDRRFGTDLILKVSLAAGLGTGVSSSLYFLCLVTVGPTARGLALGESVVVLALLAVWATWRRATGPGAPMVPGQTWEWSLVAVVAALAAVVAVLCDLGVFTALTVDAPHGGYDAWKMWNLRARFIFRGGPEWRDAFSPLVPWSLPNYPLLLPLAVARIWMYMGSEALLGPAAVALLYALSTLGAVYGALRILRGTTQACLGVLTVASTPFFIKHAASQYADVPLAFFLVATVATLCLHERVATREGGALTLAGIAGGCAAWTKDEGIVMLAIVLGVWWAGRVTRGLRWRDIVALGSGLLPIVTLLVFFKLTLAPPTFLITNPGLGAMLGKLADVPRYVTIVKAFLVTGLEFGEWLVDVPLLLAFYALLLGFQVDHDDRAGVAATVLSLGLIVLAYFAIFVLTPHPLRWHIQTSLNRLFLQVWPAAVFAYFMVVRPVPVRGAKTK